MEGNTLVILQTRPNTLTLSNQSEKYNELPLLLLKVHGTDWLNLDVTDSSWWGWWRALSICWDEEEKNLSQSVVVLSFTVFITVHKTVQCTLLLKKRFFIGNCGSRMNINCTNVFCCCKKQVIYTIKMFFTQRKKYLFY